MRNYIALTCTTLSLLAGCQSPPAFMSAMPSLGSSKVAKSEAPVKAEGVTVANNRRMDQARMLARQGKVDEAIFLYSQVLASESRADAHHALAIIHDKRGNFVQSGEHYEKALALDAHNPDLLCDRGYSYYLQGDLDNADRYLQMALKRQPGMTRAHNNLGMLMAQRGKVDAALGQFAMAGCTHAEARTNLSYALMMSGEIDAARYQLALARGSGPSLPAAQELENAMLQLAGGTLPLTSEATVAKVARVTHKVAAVPNTEPNVSSTTPAADVAPLVVEEVEAAPISQPAPTKPAPPEAVQSVEAPPTAEEKAPTPAALATMTAQELRERLLGEMKPKQPTRQLPEAAPDDLAAILTSKTPPPNAPSADDTIEPTVETELAALTEHSFVSEPKEEEESKVSADGDPAPHLSLALQKTSHVSQVDPTSIESWPSVAPVVVSDRENPLRDPTHFRYWR